MSPLLAVVPFGIQVVDGAGDPAACVTLTTTDQQRFVTDQAGWIAIDEPGLMGDTVWFTFEGEGYTMAADPLGFRGLALVPAEGQTAEVPVSRVGTPAPCSLGLVNRTAVVNGLTDRPFQLQVVDSATGRGVPMVPVEGPAATYWTDSAGRAAIRDPGLLGQSVELAIPELHGYRYVGPPLQVQVTEGGSAVVQVRRDQVAERLYRVTGRGVYRDTALLGLPAPIEAAVINGRLMSASTAMVVPTPGRDLWLWREAGRMDYPVALQEIAGALATPLPDPSAGVDLEVLVDPVTGFARSMTPLPGLGTVTLGGPAVVDDAGSSRTVAFYAVEDDFGQVSERGVLVLDPLSQVFVLDTVWATLRPAVGVNQVVSRGGYTYLEEYMRFPSTLEAAREPFRSWELLSPLLADGTVDTWPDGDERWDWRPLLDGESPGEIGADTLLDLQTGAEVAVHEDSVAWSPWRRRWHRVFTEAGGQASLLGEVWYAEADTPYGPWVFASRIATHTSVNSVRPFLHPELSGDGRRVLWEATLTSRLALGEPIPRYDQNQLMYSVDLEDDRVALPVPVYDVAGAWETLAELRPEDPEPVVAFLAPDREGADTVPVYRDGPACDGGTLRAGGEPPGLALFHAARTEQPGTVPLWYARSGDQEGLFLEVPEGWEPAINPSGYVWANPDRRHSLVMDWLPETRVEAGADLCLSESVPGRGVVFPLDVSGSPGTQGSGSWTLTLDGAVVATSPRVDLTLTAGRHVLVATWTSDQGTPTSDERWFAVAPAADPGDTGLGEDTGGLPETGETDGGADTDPPAGGDEGGGCGGCSGSGPRGGGLAAALALLVLRRRQR